MAVVTTWWKPEQGLFGVPKSPAPAPRRGTFGGQCFHVTCRNTGSDWYNWQDRRYYCDDCARRINDHCLAEGLPKLCSLHL